MKNFLNERSNLNKGQVQSPILVSEVNEVGLGLTHRKYEDRLYAYTPL